MERERATMRRSMLVAQQQLTTAQAEAADVRGANSKALAQAEDAVLQLQRRLTEQATTLAMGALEVDELRESVHKSAQQQVRLVVLLADNAVSDAQRHNALTSDACAVGQEADGRTISQLTA
jgi:predicted  nucleic acid-binding Zn-ribbon protein